MPRSLKKATIQSTSEKIERNGMSGNATQRHTRIVIDRVREPGASGRVSKGLPHSGQGSPVGRAFISYPQALQS